MILFYIAFALLVLAFVWHFATRKYLNPYKLYYLMGKKGSGKTTLIAKLALKYIKKGYTVYCTVDIPGTFAFNPKQVGKFEFPDIINNIYDYDERKKVVVLVDEVSLIWDNRKWKDMPDYVIQWYRYMRQYRVTCYLFSQSYDVDLKIRRLVDEMYLIKRYFRVLSIARRIDKDLMIHRSTAEAPSTIAEDFVLVPIIYPNSFMCTYMPKFFRWFNSYAPPKLDDIEFEIRPFPDDDKRFRALLPCPADDDDYEDEE